MLRIMSIGEAWTNGSDPRRTPHRSGGRWTGIPVPADPGAFPVTSVTR